MRACLTDAQTRASDYSTSNRVAERHSQARIVRPRCIRDAVQALLASGQPCMAGHRNPRTYSPERWPKRCHRDQVSAL